MAGYWRGAAEDEAMQDEHGFIWKAMLDTVDEDLAGARVLDAGCNRGGFLRLLCHACRIGEGWGYDPASDAVADAARLADGLPLTFETGDTVPDGWGPFDAAFSHEVLYLLHDLRRHASAVRAALSPGASYYAVMGVHRGSPLMATWHAANAAELGLPELYDIDDVVASFCEAGFEASAARLAVGFVPVTAHHSGNDPLDVLPWLEYYREHKLLLRFTRPD